MKIRYDPILNKLTSLVDPGGLLSQQHLDTLLHFTYNPTTDRLEGDREIVSLLTSFQLEDQWKISAGGEAVDFLNLQKSINYQSVVSGWKDQSILLNQGDTGWIKPSVLVPEDLTIVDLYGPAHASAVTYYHSDFTAPIEASFFGIEFIIEEEVISTDFLFYTVNYGADHSSPEVFFQRWTGLTYTAGDTATLWYETPFRVTTGQAYHISLFKASSRDGIRTPVQVRARSSDINALFVNVRYRELTSTEVVIDNVEILDGTAVYKHIVSSNYLVDASSNSQPFSVYKGTTASFSVRDTEKKFNVNNVIVNFYDTDNVTIEHTATLDKKDKTTRFFHKDGSWYYSEEGKGKAVEVASTHTASTDFGEDVTIWGEVLNYSALPTATGVINETWEVIEPQGTWLLGTKKKAGLYRSNGASWKYMGIEIPKVSASEITVGTETAVRRFSPADIKSMIDTHGV